MDIEIIQQYLDKLIKSDTLCRSSISCRLLQFLVENTLTKDSVKEFTIGIHLFGDDFDPDKSGSKVRVKVYQLRQYLKKYYASEGKNDAIRFDIEKGQYGVSFIDTTLTENEDEKKYNFRNRSTGFAIIGVLLILVSVFLFFHDDEIPFWESLIKDKSSTALIIGDVFTFYGPGIDEGFQVIRDYEINDEKEFKRYMNNHPDLKGKYNKTDYSYLSQMTPYATHYLSRFFFKHQCNLDVFMRSKIGIDIIKTNHTIFIGMPKTMGEFAPLFNEINNTSIQLTNNEITYLPSDSAQIRKYMAGTQNGIDTDYALVSCFKKPGGKKAFVFVSDHDVGIIGAVEFFTNTDSLQSFQSKLPEKTEYFTAIVKATGMDRSELGVEVLHVEPIGKDH